MAARSSTDIADSLSGGGAGDTNTTAQAESARISNVIDTQQVRFGQEPTIFAAGTEAEQRFEPLPGKYISAEGSLGKWLAKRRALQRVQVPGGPAVQYAVTGEDIAAQVELDKADLASKFDQWFLRRFDLGIPGQKAIAEAIYPDIFKKMEEQMANDVEMEVRTAIMNKYGPQNLDDYVLRFLQEEGQIPADTAMLRLRETQQTAGRAAPGIYRPGLFSIYDRMNLGEMGSTWRQGQYRDHIPRVGPYTDVTQLGVQYFSDLPPLGNGMSPTMNTPAAPRMDPSAATGIAQRPLRFYSRGNVPATAGRYTAPIAAGAAPGGVAVPGGYSLVGGGRAGAGHYFVPQI